jgi:uncharacterized SAM-binding protein YcdF (DUF218 family)
MISRLLDPAFLGLLLVLAGLLGWTRVRPRKALWGWKVAAWSGFALLWLAASPWFSNVLCRLLEPMPVDLSASLAGIEARDRALVVLAGGSRNLYEFVPSIERLDDTTQGRLLGGARIYRDHGPFGLVIVTGTGEPYVTSMADYLVLLGVPRDKIALETQATDTETNATFSAQILQKHGSKKVVLVTSALHIPRSVSAFQRAGIDVLPAPVDFRGGHGWRLIPSSSALFRTSRASHELLGRFEP